MCASGPQVSGQCRMVRSIILLCVAFLATRCTTAVNPELDTAEYFRLMKLYLGEDTFASHKCLKHQEENGWDSKAPLPMVPFTLGVEGTGHHAIEVSLTVASCTTCRDGPRLHHAAAFQWRLLHCRCCWGALQRKNIRSPQSKAMVDRTAYRQGGVWLTQLPNRKATQTSPRW